MIRVIRAEVGRLLSRRALIGIGAGAVAFAAIACFTMFSTAGETAPGMEGRRGGVSLEALAAAGGGTEAFAAGMSFAGFLVFVIAIAVFATEFSGGTFRALVLRQPGRLRLIGGKLIAFLVLAAAVVAACELAAYGGSWLMAAVEEVPTTAWLSVDGMTSGVEDFGTAFAGVAGWSIFGAALGVVFRSAPIALGVGFAWAGPFENIVVESWSTGYRWFPGQVLGSLIRGGTLELGFGRAALTASLYVAIAATAMFALVARRDVTM